MALKKNGEFRCCAVEGACIFGRRFGPSDVLEMANAVSALYSNGLGILADDPEIAYDMMGWNKDKLQEHQQEQEQQQTQTPPQPNPTPGMPGEKTVNAPNQA